MSAVGTGRRGEKGRQDRENGKRRNECRGKVSVQMYLTYRSREIFCFFFLSSFHLSLFFTLLVLRTRHYIEGAETRENEREAFAAARHIRRATQVCRRKRQGITASETGGHSQQQMYHSTVKWHAKQHHRFIFGIKSRSYAIEALLRTLTFQISWSAHSPPNTLISTFGLWNVWHIYAGYMSFAQVWVNKIQCIICLFMLRVNYAKRIVCH